MRIKLLGLAVAAAVLGFAPVFAPAFAKDDTKKSDKPEAKKDGGCKDGCCGDEDKDAKDASKKDEKAAKAGCGDCDKEKEGCEGCGKSDKAFAKAMSCDACAQSDKGPCDKCKTMLAEGKVFFVPVSGMMCSSCEGAVSAKLEKIDGVAKYAVMHRFNGFAMIVEPGKTVKLSDIAKALEGNKKFAIDETTDLKGKLTLRVSGVDGDKAVASVCDVICKLLGIKDCKNCSKDESAKTGTFTINVGDNKVSLKTIKDKLTEAKFSLADVEFHGAKEVDKKS